MSGLPGTVESQPNGNPGAVVSQPNQWQPGVGLPPDQDFRHGDEMPVDNESSSEALPIIPAQSTEGMPEFQGYEHLKGFDQMSEIPAPPILPTSVEPPMMDFGNIVSMDEPACREAFLQYVSENCCYGSGAAKKMCITKIDPGHALHYTLDTFTESRSTGYHSEPYRGGFIDGPDYGPPPAPWAIECSPSNMFHDECKLSEVPHTATVQNCYHCQAKGYIRCHRCHGWGRVRCNNCGGTGIQNVYDHHTHHMNRQHCYSCGGDGRRGCSTCGADGRITCGICGGYRSLKCYLQLKVEYKCYSGDYIQEKTDMPDELVRNVGGTVIFEQTLMPVWPIVSYFVQEINENSCKLVNQHKTAFPGARHILQKQCLRGIPVTEVHYTWNDENWRYWVYGNERKVHAPDYPQKCCWGCTIL